MGVFVLALLGALWAAEDSFNITVTVEYLEIDLLTADGSNPYPGWDLGTVAAGQSDTMTTGSGGDHVLVDNNCNTSVDFSVYVTTSAPGACGYGTPTAWTPAPTAGADQFVLSVGKGDLSSLPSSWTTVTATTSPGDVYAAGEPAGTDHHFYAAFTAPTSVSDGCQHSITVHIVAQ